MDALVIVCSGNTDVILRGHGCSGYRMLLEYERYYGLGMHALVRMLLEHGRYHGLGMDALAIVCSWNTYVIHYALIIACSWNTNVILVLVWMLS